MALRTKTIEYAFPLDTASVSGNPATARSFPTKTIYIPETSSRTFLSVFVVWTACESHTAVNNLTAFLGEIQLGSAGYTGSTVTQTITNSGENWSFTALSDFTSYFNTNFSGASMTMDARMTCTQSVSGAPTINCTAKVVITYEYDDASASTRIKTVKIPVDGNTGNLTTSYANVGGVASQIPALDSFLPEASKVYRDIYFQMDVHTGTTAAATAQLDMSYDGGSSTISDGAWAHTLASDQSYRRIDSLISTLNTAAAGTIQAKTTSVTGKPCPCLSGLLVVTYEYDHDSSTTLINSIEIPLLDENGWSGGTTVANASRFQRDISIQEPGTITLVQSGVLLTCIDAGAITMVLNIGGQSNRTFTHAATVRGGHVSHMRRVDSGAVGGAGMTLARGFNTITITWWTTSATTGNLGSNVSGALYLNYTSSKASAGSGVHATTTRYILRPYTTLLIAQRAQYSPTSGFQFGTDESNWWVMGVGYTLWLLVSGTTAANLAFALQAQVKSGEAEQLGWRGLYNALYASDGEIGPSLIWGRARTEFKRWPLDTDSSRLVPNAARDYRFDVNLAVAGAQYAGLLTDHHHTYTIAGTISGSAGGTVTIRAYRDDTGERIADTSRAGNGAYSITWYDDTVPVTVEAYEDSTHKGRAASAVAGNTFDINLSAGGGGGMIVHPGMAGGARG